MCVYACVYVHVRGGGGGVILTSWVSLDSKQKDWEGEK